VSLAVEVRRLARMVPPAVAVEVPDPVELFRAAVGEPDPWQAEVLMSSSPRVLLNCCRQSGKSTVAALLNVHTALYRPGSLCLMVSPTLRQSGELFRKARGLYGLVAPPGGLLEETQLSMRLANGSRLVSLPGKEDTVRGYSAAALLSLDEAARVPDQLYAAVRPMLAVSNGRLLGLSTPFGTRGWFFEGWRSAEGWQRFEVSAADCPRIPAEFLEEERRNIGEFWFAQEYECRFLDAQSAAFRREDVDRAFEEEVETWRF
jgi:hypothetical protein